MNLFSVFSDAYRFMASDLIAIDEAHQAQAGLSEAVGRQDPRDSLADHFTSLISEHALRTRVPIGDDAVQSRGDDRVARGFHDRGEAPEVFFSLRARVHFIPQRIDR